jgi:hypothetical protein
MSPNNPTTASNPNGLSQRPLPPDQISPKAVVLKVMQLKNVARRNWKLLIIFIAIGAGIGFVYDILNKKPSVYSADILFNLGGGGSASGGLGELGALAGAFGIGQGTPDANIFVGDNFLIYAKSRPVLEKTLMKNDTINGKDTMLVNYYIRHSGIRDKEWEKSDTLRSFYFSRAKNPNEYTKLEQIAMSDICTRIATEMSVTQPERKSSFMELRCAMEDEMLAATFLTSHLETIEQDYRQKQTKKSREMYDLLRSRADSIARVMTNTDNRLAQYIDQNQQIVVAQGKVTETKLQRNSSFLSTLYYQALQSADNMRLSMIREAPLFTIIKGVYYPLYKDVPSTLGVQAGIALAILLAVIVIFLRETYRSIMQEN